MKTTLYSKNILLAGILFITSLFSLLAAPCDPAEPIAFPTDRWSVSVFSDNAFTAANYVGYYTQSNSSGNGLTYLSTNAWASSSNPASTIAASTPDNITAYQGCALANTDNFSFIYKRTFGLAGGVYKCSFKQTVGTGNSMQFLIDGKIAFTSSIGTPVTTIYIPANAQLQVKSVAGTGNTSAELVSVVPTVPRTLLPGSLVADKTICYNTTTGSLGATMASDGCVGTKTYQWSLSIDGITYTDIAGATSFNYSTVLTTTKYFKRKVTDICLSTAETEPVKITVDASAATFVPGTIGAPSTICSGTSILLTNTVSASGGYRDSTIAYQWYTYQGGTYSIISGATNATYTTPILTSPISYRRAASSTSACGTFTGASNIITISTTSPLLAPASITGTLVQCPGNTGDVFTASAVSGALSYAWTLPAGVTAVSGQTTRTITVDFGGGYGGGTISCAAVNACGNGTAVSATLSVGACDWLWTGAVNTNWFTAGNWSPNSVPSSTSNVTIPNVSNKPLISIANASANNIVIDPGSSLTISGVYAISVYGNLVNNGTLTTAVTAKIQTAKASSSQTFSGDLTGIKYLIKANSGTLNLGNDWIVSGRIDLKQGTINVNGHALTFDVVNGGYVGYTTGDVGTITGDVTVTKPLGKSTHNIATPLTGVTATQINDDFQVINSTNGRSRLFNWNAATQSWPSVYSGLPLSTTLSRGTGYNFFCTTAGTLDFTGTYSQTATPISLTGSANNPGDWFLFGNPYLADLNWEAIGKTNVDPTVYYWNQSAQAYATYTTGGESTNGGTAHIPVLQGFFVASIGSGTTTISVSPNAIFNTNPVSTFYRVAAPSDKFNFVVKDNTGKSDEAVIVINEDATSDFDGSFDAYKFQNPSTSLNLYTTVGATDYAVNTIPAADQIVSLSFVAPASGVYTIESTDVNLSTTNVYLKDKVTGTVTPIDALPYTFTAESTDAPERFDVMFRTSATTSTQSAAASAGISFASFQKDLVILNQSLQMSDATIVITDLTGNTVKTITGVSISNNTTVNLSELSSGMYMIKLVDQANGNAYSGKVSIQ